MSLSVCLPDLIAKGKIPPEKAEPIRARYEELLARYEAEGMARPTAEALATDKALALMDRDNLIKKRNALLQVQAQSRWLSDMRRMSGGSGAALDHRIAEGKLVALDKKIDRVRGRLFATLSGFLEQHRRNVAGVLRHKDDLTLTGRELFGEATGDVNAREMADAIKRAFETARTMRNAVGGDTGKLETFGLPQHHDSAAVRAVPFEQWRAHPSIERVKVRDLDSGEWASGIKRETLLRGIYESIRTDGANKARPGQMFAGSLASRRNDPRILHFDNFDDWMAYARDFGGGDNIYDTIVGHLHAMAREIALMEELGPNPAATIRFQTDWMEKSVKLHGTQRQVDTLPKRTARIAAMYDELTGANKIPGDTRIALGFSAFRSVQVAAKLGGAVLSAVPDFATMLKTAHFNRVPPMRMLARYTALWNPAARADREMAVRLGLVVDDWLQMSSSAARYTGEEMTGEISRRLADFTLRASGLSRHTRNGQWAFGMEFLAHLTAMRERAFTNLDPAMQRSFARHGLGEAEWDAYRATPPVSERGSLWIMPTDAGKAGDRVLDMVLSETDYAIIMPDLRTRTTINFPFQSRPLLGEIYKSTLLFKAFPVAMYNLHFRRMMEQDGAWNRAVYGASLFAMMVAGGALSTQLIMISYGKDPRPMDDIRFLGKAIVQSGGLGLFGDLLYNSETSYGGGLAMTLAGPGAQVVNNFGNATIGNLKRTVDGDPATEADFGGDLLQFAEKEMPLRNLWYTRLAWDRIIGDTVRRWADDDPAAAWARMERRAEEEGTAYFAPPGQGYPPARLPELGNALPD